VGIFAAAVADGETRGPFLTRRVRTLTEGLDLEHSAVGSEPKIREYGAALIFQTIRFFAAFMFIGAVKY
jgi:hypothetical protein